MADDTMILHHDGTWFVHLGEKFDHEKADSVTADGRDMQPTNDRVTYRYVRWYAVDGDRPHLVRVRWKPRTFISHYVLKNREAAEALGEGDRPERVEPGDQDYEDDLFDRLYERVRDTEQYDDTVIDLDGATVVEGEPPPHDGLTWVPDLPYALRHRSEYGHLFPGKLVGFRDALAEALADEFGDARGLGRMEGVQYRRPGETVKVALSIPFDPPVREPKRLKSGRKSTRDTVEKRQRREWSFDPSDAVRGETREHAVEKWHRLIDEFAAQVRDATAKPCGHCAGSGVASDG